MRIAMMMMRMMSLTAFIATMLTVMPAVTTMTTAMVMRVKRASTATHILPETLLKTRVMRSGLVNVDGVIDNDYCVDLGDDS